MTFAHSRPVLSRVLVALFALWLPAATGQGGKATCIAAASLAKSVTAARPHLSCHGEHGSGRSSDCCCKSQAALRAAACGCHDGAQAFGSAHDPMLGSWRAGIFARVAARTAAAPATATPGNRPLDAPDPPPPQLSPSVFA